MGTSAVIPWMSMDVHGYPWIGILCMDVHGFTRHRYPRISFDNDAYPWNPWNREGVGEGGPDI